jgi:hypothetical protein
MEAASTLRPGQMDWAAVEVRRQAAVAMEATAAMAVLVL